MSSESIDKFFEMLDGHLVGRKSEVKLGLACLIANGHLLIEDVPGMGKTTMAKILAKFIGLELNRVQFTYDLLPSDLLGGNIYIPSDQGFRFFKGPLFTELLLADELNRGSPKTQSALLEAMEEKSVSIEGETHQLPRPFLVLATQNPLDHIGTNPLPESQLDRFTLSLNLKFPSRSEEASILMLEDFKGESGQLNQLPSLGKDEFFNLQKKALEVTCTSKVQGYILDLIGEIRLVNEHAKYLSPRATKDLLRVSRALAVLDKRDFVIPDDVKTIFPHVVAHRIQAGRGLKITIEETKQVFESVSIP